MRKSSQLGIEQMAKRLEMRKKNNEYTTLLLGARAGQLFRSADFYNNLQLFSNLHFHRLPRFKQFKEVHTILTSGKLSETDLNSFLRSALRDIDVTSTDISLASLIRNHYFNEIISTNIDVVLEEALLRIEMKEDRDYEVIRIGRNIGRNVPGQERPHPIRITKPFGDFASQDYIIRGRPSHLDNTEMRSSLLSLLKKDLLIIGIDPDWDKDILRMIPVNTKATVWFVSEDTDIVGKSPFLSDMLRARHATHILVPEGSYDFFVGKLHDYLCGNVSPNYTFASPQSIQNIQNQVNRTNSILQSIELQLKNLTTMLSDMYETLEVRQSDHQALLDEIQNIRKKLEESRGD